MKDLEDETIRMQTEAASNRARMTQELFFKGSFAYMNYDAGTFDHII